MAGNVELGSLEAIVARLVEAGRCDSKSEVLREGVGLVEERERRLDGLDAAIERGIADACAARVEDAATVFDELKIRCAELPKGRDA